MKTEKLYYESAYINDFYATVLSCESCEGGFSVILDRTAFFPEEGGQSADGGKLGGLDVLGVTESHGIISHILPAPLAVGSEVYGVLNFDERLEKMRIHTAEHILSGIIHALYGADSTGFPRGHDEVTFDTSRVMEWDELCEVERLANVAVMANMAVTVSYPAPEELPNLEYRSKLDITEDVRIVKIGNVDSCACCAPHVNTTGEIGLIKIVSAVKHRGGSRITMLAGERAYNYVCRVINEASRAAVMLSSPETDFATELEARLRKHEAATYELTGARSELAEALAAAQESTEGNALILANKLDEEGRRKLVNIAKDKVLGTLVVLSGSDGAYRYVLHSGAAGGEFSALVKAANEALSGKGGGRPPMAQGTYLATLGEIKAYFGV